MLERENNPWDTTVRVLAGSFVVPMPKYKVHKPVCLFPKLNSNYERRRKRYTSAIQEKVLIFIALISIGYGM